MRVPSFGAAGRPAVSARLADWVRGDGRGWLSSYALRDQELSFLCQSRAEGEQNALPGGIPRWHGLLADRLSEGERCGEGLLDPG